ncbi:MAG: hypothetical protein K1000chlam2_01631 [Chlamydiae bacterium]|nr:hypothetical protein [Chlamydiota bacterium]
MGVLLAKCAAECPICKNKMAMLAVEGIFQNEILYDVGAKL